MNITNKQIWDGLLISQMWDEEDGIEIEEVYVGSFAELHCGYVLPGTPFPNSFWKEIKKKDNPTEEKASQIHEDK